jgi:hypothetical protein
MSERANGGPLPHWAMRLIALALGALTTVVVVHNQRDVGIARDETVYMTAGSRYAAWWGRALTGAAEAGGDRGAVDGHGPGATDNNREHPPLLKTCFGWSKRVLHDRLHWLDELTAYRLPSALLHGVLIALVFAMTANAWGLIAGLVAALFMLLMPRALFHAGLACFDGPITTLWFATVWAYHRALVTRRSGWLVGLCFGLALATKHNALLLPFAIGAHYAVLAWRHGATALPVAGSRATRPFRAVQRWGRGLRTLRPGALLAMAGLGPLVLIALWPWLWFDTARHLAQWIAFHTHHVHYHFEYLGDNWNAPPFPWHVAFVTTWFTVPVVTLAAGAIGVRVLASARLGAAAARSPQAIAQRPALLLLFSAAAAIGPFLLGSTPIFGAEKHWEPAMPSLAIAAAVGLCAAARSAARVLGLRGPRGSYAVVLGIIGAALASAAVETFHPQPYGLTAYNALAGGAPGAADLGMNRQFWGVAARGVLPVIAATQPVPGHAPVLVYSHDASPAWGLYARLGLLPPGFPDAGGEAAGIEASQVAIVVHERHFARHDFMIWKAYGTVQPIFVLRLDGVPLVSVYRRPAVANER